jgi:hypothetical protein
MARIYDGPPSQSDEDQTSFALRIIRLEILSGAVFTVLGGFLLRASDNYSLIVIGTTLICLGLVRLWRRHETKSDTETGLNQSDRLLGKLGRELDANYTVVTNFEVDDEFTIPYLVLGPHGITILDTLDFRGTVEADSYQDRWKLVPESESQDEVPDDDPEEAEETVRNPISLNENRSMALKQQLRDDGFEAVPVTHRLVLLNYRIEGEPLNADSVVLLRDLDDEITQFDQSPLSWEEIDDIERALGLRE